jgi:putative PIN family toxin of toxin-antitoxin system
LPSKPTLTVCLDANVIISGVAYGGIPLQILNRLYDSDFSHVTGSNILEEVRRVLINKMGQDEYKVDPLINRLRSASTVCVPTGKINPIHYQPDNKVLEVAIIGKCDVLVTGDKKHLLPLKSFQGVVIESPSHFLKRLNTLKGS